jgi:hypothetical protein
MVSKIAGDPSQMKWCHKATRFVAVRCAPKKKRAIRNKNERTAWKDGSRPTAIEASQGPDQL